MAMEINGNPLDYAVKKQNNSSHAAQEMAQSSKNKETQKAEKTAEGAKPAKSGSTQEYINKLQKQVPYMTLEIGSSLSMARDKRMGVVTMNPQLLEKMQNDPEAEKKYTQLLKDIERAEKTVNAYYDAMGGCVERTSHCYIDENGNYYHFAYTRRDDKLNKKLREESQKNAEKQIEKARERSQEKAEQLEEKLEEKAKEAREAKEGSEEQKGADAASKAAGKIITEKLKNAKDGEIYLNGEDMQPIMEAIREGVSTSAGANRQPAAGANMNLQV